MIAKLNTSSLRFAAVAGLIVITSCVRPPSPEAVFEDTAPKLADSTPAGKLSIHVYLDSTSSMGGFAASGPGSRYSQFLQELQRSIGRMSASATVKYYQFGSTIVPYAGSQPIYMAASQPSFYADPKLFKTTNINLVIASARPEHVTIVLTDLFEDSSNISRITEEAKRAVFSRKLALAVAGIRGDFKGRVHDIGQQGLSFSWDSKGDPKRYRPFYALFAGRTGDVAQVLESLGSVSKMAVPQDTVLLSADVVTKGLDWSRAEVQALIGANESAKIGYSGDGAVAGGFNIVGKGDSMQLRARLPVSMTPFVPRINYARIQSKATRVLGLGSKSTEKLQPRDAAVEWNLRADGSDAVVVDVKLSLLNLSSGMTYAIALHPELDAKAFDFPAFCQSWSVDQLQVREFANGRGTFDGAKTLNLADLISDLWTATIQAAKPELGKLYLYVRK
jgi:hypothetical protein